MKLLRELMTLIEGVKKYKHIIYFKDYHPEDGQQNPEQKTIIMSDTDDKREVMKRFIDDVGSVNILTHQVVDESYINETESKKSTVSKDVASKVYHRDYIKTKNKKYRKYNPSEDNK